MINIEKGRYWDEGIELISGCTPCSPGCDHCWSLAASNRFKKCPVCGCTKKKCDEAISAGKRGCCPDCQHDNRVYCHPDRLSRFNTRRPKVFAIWNDLFHEDVPLNFIDDVVCCAARYDQNTYLVLTKRPYSLYEWADSTNGRLDYLRTFDNLFLGLTVCNQQEADEKIPVFLQVPGKKFLSIEPMLGAIDISKYINLHWKPTAGIDLDSPQFEPRVNSVILGGETGPGARPLHPDWVRSVRDQCAAAGVPFFFKQWGEYVPWGLNCCDYLLDFNSDEADRKFKSIVMPPYIMYRVGRKKAGRFLDGRTHDELPWRKA